MKYLISISLVAVLFNSAIICNGQTKRMDKIVYDTIPARFQVYKDKCEFCPIYFVSGYVVFENIMEIDSIHGHSVMGKDTTIAFTFYYNPPRRTDINPYLRSDKNIMWMNVTVWDYKLDRECNLKQLKGL